MGQRSKNLTRTNLHNQEKFVRIRKETYDRIAKQGDLTSTFDTVITRMLNVAEHRLSRILPRLCSKDRELLEHMYFEARGDEDALEEFANEF